MKFYGKRIRVRLAFKMELQRGKRILDQTIMLLLFTETAAAYMCSMGSVEIVLPPPFYSVVTKASDVEICCLG